MREKFSEFYKVPDNELKQAWQADTFSFDANVLLNLYRYTPETRSVFFNVLEKISARIWISYQAAHEYQKNRLSVISSQRKAYEDIREILNKKRSQIESELNEYKRHPYLKIGELNAQIESGFSSIISQLDNLEKDHPDYLHEDPILEKLSDLLRGKIGDDMTEEQLEKIFREGKKRYDEEIPPGYKDKAAKKNESNRSLYGDVLVWTQLISKAKGLPASVIFVTDDRKDDWWYKFEGKTIGPRPELIREFRNETNKRIHIYQADRFLELASKDFLQSENKAAVSEIRKLRIADEMAIQDLEKKLLEIIQQESLSEESSFEKGVRTAITERATKNSKKAN